MTESFSFIKSNVPSYGTNAVIFLLFFFNKTLIPFLNAELGCFAYIPTFPVHIPEAIQAPPKGSYLNYLPECDLQ